MNKKPYVISHKNGNKFDNRASNLEWDQVPILVKSNADVVEEERTAKDIQKYMDEAFDKIWLMRTHPVEDPQIEKERIENINRIRNIYSDIPDEGYSTWECGYWNGILGALRWVLGEEKDFLDT